MQPAQKMKRKQDKVFPNAEKIFTKERIQKVEKDKKLSI